MDELYQVIVSLDERVKLITRELTSLGLLAEFLVQKLPGADTPEGQAALEIEFEAYRNERIAEMKALQSKIKAEAVKMADD